MVNRLGDHFDSEEPGYELSDELNYLEMSYHVMGEKKSTFLQENFIHDLTQIKILTKIPVYKQINEALQNYIDVMFKRINEGEF